MVSSGVLVCAQKSYNILNSEIENSKNFVIELNVVLSKTINLLKIKPYCRLSIK